MKHWGDIPTTIKLLSQKWVHIQFNLSSALKMLFRSFSVGLYEILHYQGNTFSGQIEKL